MEDLVAMWATVEARLVAETKQDALHLRVLLKHPGWCDGPDLPVADEGVDERKRISQLNRVLTDDCAYPDMSTDLIPERFTDDAFDIMVFRSVPDVPEKGPEFLLPVEQQEEDLLQSGVHFTERGHFIVEQVTCLHRIVQRVVVLVRLELVVLEQAMIRPGRKQERREEQRIDDVLRADAGLQAGFADVPEIVVEDIMAADEGCALEKLTEGRSGVEVKAGPVIADTPDIKNFPGLWIDLGVDVGNGGHWFSARVGEGL
jgi:hypothetical protein